MASAGTQRSMSPLTGYFGVVSIDADGAETEESNERRGRKRSNSALAAKNDKVDDQLPLNRSGDNNWIHSPGFKRRQSDGPISHPRQGYCADEEGSEEVTVSHGDGKTRFRISRLPLGRRKLDQETLDQAFGVSNPLLDLTTNASLSVRSRKPSSLHIPPYAQQSVELEDATSPSCSSPFSPVTVAGGSTFDAASGERRGTFGSLLPPTAQPTPAVQVLSTPDRRLRHQSDTTTTPPSSAVMEFLYSPASTSTSSQPSRTLRHAVSFETPRKTSFLAHEESYNATSSHASGSWSQRQRWYSAGDEQSSTKAAPPVRPERKLRAVRSVASLRETVDPSFEMVGPSCHVTAATAASAGARTRKTSNSSDGSSASETFFTPLAPRTGAKKFDRTRLQQIQSLPSNADAAGSDPAAAATSCLSPASTIAPLPSQIEMRDPIGIGIATTAARPSLQLALTNESVVTESKKAEPKLAKVAPSSSISINNNNGLRTGPEVYQGIEIPCASIYLYSDPEDNFEPAIALSMSASKLKKLKKKSASTGASSSGNGTGGARGESATGHARCASTSSAGAVHNTPQQQPQQQHAKGSSRWWSQILHS